MKLVGALTSPYVRKVRVVLAERGLDVGFVQEDVWGSDAMLAVNPLGKVPCLLLDDGMPVFDSRVIVEHLDALPEARGARLIPQTLRERTAVRTMEALADGICDASILARLEATWAPRGPARSQAWIDRQLARVDSALAAMARTLGERDWLVGDAMTMADVAAGCALGYLDFRFPANAWRERHPGLARLMQTLAQRPSFEQTRPPSPQA